MIIGRLSVSLVGLSYSWIEPTPSKGRGGGGGGEKRLFVCACYQVKSAHPSKGMFEFAVKKCNIFRVIEQYDWLQNEFLAN